MTDNICREKQIISSIPSSIVDYKTKQSLIKARGSVMKRNIVTEGQAKVVTQWTIPKMMLKAAQEDKVQRDKEKQAMNLK